MTDQLTPVARALGRIPTGLYVVGSRAGERPIGFVASLFTQVGFEPPTVCVAIAHGRDHLDVIRANERFSVSILDDSNRPLMGSFFKPGSPFDEVPSTNAPGGSPVLSEALAWLECRWSGEYETGDHTVVFGTVEEACLQREGDPALHLRKNGLAY